ncbi:DUF6879 family protein [Virgisporangium aurantiacum]|uniref:DUF6879 domain-containing protein n=1 Tax=Virgisporangium aurantiacum TaxID=175570 RepID=A0A8J3Z0P0_9ACTN|nr:DUF6879 family protein [Virgisporangium aurantiacum]GIJ54153.1 hypothetical protein Vau01_016690 [Virgisporangium aurantiacum]
MTPIAYGEFQAAIRASRRAWHIEMSDTYNVEAEDDPFARFLAGEHDDYSWLGEWLGFIAEVTARGTVVQRARLVTLPHSDYTSWGLACAAALTRAGEDIRYLPREQALDIPFPKEDFWLFDDERIILSVFSDDGRQGGFASADDPGLLAQCQTVRNEVWARATPYSEYLASIN